MAQLTVANILDIMAASAYLAELDMAKNPIAASRMNKLLPVQLYMEREIIQWGYDQSVDGEELRKVANYGYDLCGKYGLLAQDLAGGAGGLVVVDGSTTQQEANIFPIIITQANFTSATFYPDVRLANYTNVVPRLEEINRLLQPSEFSINAFGLTILLDGFDATANEYTITIDRYSTP